MTLRANIVVFQGVHNPRKNSYTGSSQADNQEAQELGVSMINFVGGEPLLREDLPEIINCVDKTTSSTGFFLQTDHF